MLKKGFGNFIMNNDKEFLATEPIGKLLFKTGQFRLWRSDDQYALQYY